MTTATAEIFEAVSVPAATCACAHCGLDVPLGLIEPTSEEQFCCAGCRAVYQTLHACGLEAFYRLRDGAGQAAHPTDSRFASFDTPGFHKLYVRPHSDGASTVDLVLEGVTCAACIWLIERLPYVVPGVLEARLSLRQSTVRIVWKNDAVPLSHVAIALDRLGYTPHPAKGVSRGEIYRIELRRRLIDLAVAGALMGNVMLLAFALYAGRFGQMAELYRNFFRIVSALLGTLALAWPGRAFFRGAVSALRVRRINLDVPIALALFAGGVAGTVNVILCRGEIYFDTLSVLVFLLLIGRFLQFRQQRYADDALELLFSLAPATCRRICHDGTIEELPVESLVAGDHIEVRSGDTVPADGEVETGQSSICQALLTGESLPTPIGPGAQVFGGSQNQGAALHICVTSVGEQTRVGRLMRVVEQGISEKPPIVQLADRVGAWFTLVICVAAVSTFAFWMQFSLSAAIDHSVALLIVTCPCVLGLATPLTMAMAIGQLSRRDILVKRGAAIEKLAGYGEILLDKTGTLTAGRLRLVHWEGPDELKPLVVALERHSQHPVALALVESLKDLDDAAGAGYTTVAARCSPSPDTPGEGRGEGDLEQLVAQPPPAVAPEITAGAAVPHESPSAQISPGIPGEGAARRDGRAPAGSCGLEDVIDRGDGGLRGLVGGRTVRIGSGAYLARAGVIIEPGLADRCRELEHAGTTVVFLALDDRAVALAGLADQLRTDSPAAVGSLRSLGWRPRIISGDAQPIVSSIAAAVGIEPASAQARMTPEAKLAVVRQQRAGVSLADQVPTLSRSTRGGKRSPGLCADAVVMVGDGVNDAAALAAADVGIAVHGGAEASLAAADVYIAVPGLASLVFLIRAARRTMRTIHRNLILSLAYNLVAGVLAAAGKMNPLVAAVLMPISSASVLGWAIVSVRRIGTGSLPTK